MAFKATGIDFEWKGKNENVKGYDIQNGIELVSLTPKFYRAAEVELLINDSEKHAKI